MFLLLMTIVNEMSTSYQILVMPDINIQEYEYMYIISLVYQDISLMAEHRVSFLGIGRPETLQGCHGAGRAEPVLRVPLPEVGHHPSLACKTNARLNIPNYNYLTTLHVYMNYLTCTFIQILLVFSIHL